MGEDASRALGALTTMDITRAQYDALAADLLAEMQASVEASGRVHRITVFGLERHAALTADLVGRWLQGADDAVILKSLYWLGNIAAGYLQRMGSSLYTELARCDVTALAQQGWEKAVRVHRGHIPADTAYRLTLPVEEIEGLDEWEPVTDVRKNSAIKLRVRCIHWTARGYLSGTCYDMNLKAVGRNHGKWKMTRAAHQGVAKLIDWVGDSSGKDIRDWEAVFESTRLTKTETDWRDGRETFTSTEYKLHPGKVVAVRQLEKGTGQRFRIQPEVTLPEGSIHADTPFHRLFETVRRLEAVEALVAHTGSSN